MFLVSSWKWPIQYYFILNSFSINSNQTPLCYRVTELFSSATPTPSYLLSQMVGQTACLSIARLINCISRGSLASSGQVGLKCIPQCNQKSSVTRSPSRAGYIFSWSAFPKSPLLTNSQESSRRLLLSSSSTFFHSFCCLRNKT